MSVRRRPNYTSTTKGRASTTTCLRWSCLRRRRGKPRNWRRRLRRSRRSSARPRHRREATTRTLGVTGRLLLWSVPAGNEAGEGSSGARGSSSSHVSAGRSRNVRVHSDSRAAESAAALQAVAYTVGPNIVFARGRYEPQRAEGQALLAHELAHVIQQGAARPRAQAPALAAAPIVPRRDTFGVVQRWAVGGRRPPRRIPSSVTVRAA